MKIFFRILIILITAIIVGGILFALVNNNVTNESSGFERHGSTKSRPDGNFAPRPERGREEFDGRFFFPGGVIKGLLVVFVVMVIWLNVGKLLGRRKAIQVK
jgi:hypothetical protein